MPNTPRTHSGKSLRDRASTAAKLTARDQQRRRAGTREPSPSHARPSSSRAAERERTAGSGRRSQTSSKREDAAKRRASEKGSRRKPEKAGRKKPTGISLPSVKRRHAVTGAVVGALVLLVVMLYPVGQTYYQSLRDEQRLEAQVAAVTERNDAVGKENDELKTDEGIEDAAREQGYVNPNDNAVIITNAGKASSGSQLPDKVDADKIEAPHTWYYDILDVIFFVQQD